MSSPAITCPRPPRKNCASSIRPRSASSGLETLLPISVTTLIGPNYLTWPQLIEKLDHTPRAGSRHRPRHSQGRARTPTSPLSIPPSSGTIDVTKFASKSRNSPFQRPKGARPGVRRDRQRRDQIGTPHPSPRMSASVFLGVIPHSSPRMSASDSWGSRVPENPTACSNTALSASPPPCLACASRIAPTTPHSLLDLLDRAEEQAVHILVFPELALTGYTCGDLFHQPALPERRPRHA